MNAGDIGSIAECRMQNAEYATILHSAIFILHFNRLGHRRRGFIYTLFAIAMVASVMMLLSLQSSYRPEVHVAEKIRSDEMRYLEGGIVSDLGRGTYISGKRAILSLVNSEIVSGVYNTTSNQSIRDIMMTGRYNSTNASLMGNTTMMDWTRVIMFLSGSLGYNANISILSLNVSQKDAFNLDATALARTLLIDGRLSMQLDRTGAISAEIGIDNVEDPFVVIESFGYGKQQIKKCNSTTGTSDTSGRAWGTAYVNLTQTNYSLVTQKNKKILIVDTLSGRSDYNGFMAVVSENSADVPPSPYIVGAAGATATRMGSLVVKQNNTLWMTNITGEPTNSCYFEAPGGPSFLDRLEGSNAPSAKYQVPGINTGIGSFIYVPGLPAELQKGSDTYAIDYEYFT